MLTIHSYIEANFLDLEFMPYCTAIHATQRGLCLIKLSLQPPPPPLNLHLSLVLHQQPRIKGLSKKQGVEQSVSTAPLQMNAPAPQPHPHPRAPKPITSLDNSDGNYA